MRFFLDENLPQGLIEHLGSIFRAHEFMGVKALKTKGMEDVPLFSEVAKSGCQVFVTGDMRQLQRENERSACREAGLHWMGVHHVQSTGYHVIAGPASTLVHALPFVLDRLTHVTEPQYFKLKKSERNYTQVFHSNGNL